MHVIVFFTSVKFFGGAVATPAKAQPAITTTVDTKHALSTVADISSTEREESKPSFIFLGKLLNAKKFVKNQQCY